MKKITIILLLFSTIISLTFSSCMCGCDCIKNIGCKIFTVRLNSNDSVIAIKKFCSQVNIYNDKALQDSVEKFRTQYQSYITTIIEKDSIYEHEAIKNLKCDEIDRYKYNGYDCECAK